MKKKKKEEAIEDYDQQNLEIIKAVAQARLSHSATSSSSSSTNEFDAHRLKFISRPSRFKLQSQIESSKQTPWDFGQSLWDSYEIVNVSRKLEAGLLLDYGLDHEPSQSQSQIPVKKKESKNSLRNLLNLKSSRRFDESSS
jgi:hypothetical protein